MNTAGRAAAIVGTGLAVLALSLWRRDIPMVALARRYGDATSRTLALPNGVVLHYRDIGPADAPVLVCLHGYSASSMDWLPWARRLEARYRLLLVDLPGHGLTVAPPQYQPSVEGLEDCVAALVDRLGLPPFVLVGSSMGGQVAITYALAHPHRIAGLVLVASLGGAAEPTRVSSPPLALRLLGSPVGRFVLRHIDLTPLVRRSLRNAWGNEGRGMTEALVRQCTDFARAPGHRAILTGLQLGNRAADLLGQLPFFDKPTLVMAGEADRLVPLSQARVLAAAFPDAQLIVYRGVGHVPMQEIPDRSAEDLAHWLTTQAVPA